LERLNTFAYSLTFPGGDKMMMMMITMMTIGMTILLNIYFVLGTQVLSMHLGLIHNPTGDSEMPTCVINKY